MRISLLALPTLAIVQLHASSEVVGLLESVQMIPIIVLGIVMGSWVDRRPRRLFLLSSEILRGLALGSLGLAFLFYHLTVIQLEIVAGALGVFTAMATPANSALLPQVIEEPRLPEAYAKLVGARTVARLLGSAIGGTLIQTISAVGAIGANAGVFLLSAVCLFGTRMRSCSPSSLGRERFGWNSIRWGIRYIFTHPILRHVTEANAVWNFGLSIWQVAYLLYAYRIRHFTPAMVGWLAFLGGVSGLGTTLISRPLIARLGPVPLLVATPLMAGLSYGLVPWVPPHHAFWWFTVSHILGDGALALYNVTQLILVQTHSPQELKGRIAATNTSIFLAPRPLGNIAAGWLVAVVGSGHTLLVSGAIIVTSVFWFWRKHKQ